MFGNLGEGFLNVLAAPSLLNGVPIVALGLGGSTKPMLWPGKRTFLQTASSLNQVHENFNVDEHEFLTNNNMWSRFEFCMDGNSTELKRRNVGK